MQDYKISVIIPVFNAEKYLEEVITDLTAQTLRDIEIILINDGSTDKSLQILERYKKQDDRISVISQSNQGAGSARNTGMNVAKGKYLLFLDADDRFEKNLLERCYIKAIETEADIVLYTGDAFDYATEKKSPMPWLLQWGKYKDCLLENGLIGQKKNDILYQITNSTVWNKLFRSEFVKENALRFQEIYVVDSLYFVMLAMAYARKTAVLNESLIHYRKNNPTGQLKNHDKNPSGIYEALLKVREHLIAGNVYKDVEDSYINYAAESCVTRFHFFSSLDSEKELYIILHEEGLSKLGIEEGMERIGSTAIREKCREISRLDYEEYRFQKDEKRYACGLSTFDMYAMQDFPIAYASRIVLYGAGNVGKSYFIQIMNLGKYRLVSWVDQQYEKCGYPVEAPERIQSLDYDAVIIAVLKESIYFSIRDFLKKLGVEEDKIYWKEPVEV